MYPATVISPQCYRRNLHAISRIAQSYIGRLNVSLIARLERKLPGDMFGWAKYEEMERVQKKARLIQRTCLIPKSELPLLEIVLNSHDLGRPVESLVRYYTDKGRNPPRCTPQTNAAVLETIKTNFDPTDAKKLAIALNQAHGEFSARLLIDSGVLHALSDSDARDVIAAVRFHHVRELPFDTGQLSERARRWCLGMRAADTLDFFGRGAAILEEPGISNEFNKHFKSELVPTLDTSKKKPVCEAIMSAFERGVTADKADLNREGSYQGYVVFTLCRISQLPKPMQKELFKRRLHAPFMAKLKEWAEPALYDRVDRRLQVVIGECQ